MKTIKTTKQGNAITNQIWGKTFSEMQKKVGDSNFDNNAANEMVNQLSNKLLRQIIVDSFNLKSKIIDMFAVPGMNVSEGEQILEHDLIASTDYDGDDWVPKTLSEPEILQMFLHTKDKKRWNIQINKSILKAAFTSIPAFDQFIQNKLAQITKSMELYMYENIIADVAQNVKITYSASTQPTDKDPEGFTPLQQSIIQFFNLVENATGVPVKDFNLDGRARKISTVSLEECVILANPTTLNLIKKRALAKIFNQEDLAITTKIETLKIAGIPTGQMIFMEKQAYRVYKRILEMSSQYYNRPMKFDWILHLWLVRGVVNWKTGFKFVLADINNTPYNLGFNGTLKNDGKGNFTGVEINLNNTSKTSMSASSWVLIRILDENGTIVKDLIYNKEGTSQVGPDDLQYGCETFKVEDLDISNKFIKTTESFASIPEDGTYQVQAFGYFGGDKSITSTSTTPIAVKKTVSIPKVVKQPTVTADQSDSEQSDSEADID